MSARFRDPSRSAARRQEFEQPLVAGLPRTLRGDRLDADMVGAGVPMLPDAFADRGLAAPCDHRVEKPARPAAGQLVVAKSLAAPGIDVILELQIARQR